MDPAVLRPGRFGKLLYVPLPGPTERGLVLKALGRKKPIDIGVDLLAIGQMQACDNFSGADLAALVSFYFRLNFYKSFVRNHDSPQWYDIVYFEHKLSWLCFELPQKASFHLSISSRGFLLSFPKRPHSNGDVFL